MRNLVSAFCILSMLSGCIGDWDRKLDEKNIDTQIAGNSSVFSTKNVRLNIKEYKQILYITLDYKVPKNFSFPVDSFYGDTLTETRFYLKLSCNGMPVMIDEKVADYEGLSRNVADSNCFIISFNKQSIRSSYHDEVQLPLTVFHNLKKGKQRFEGELFTRSFYGTHFDTTSNQYENLEMPCNIIQGKIKFILDIPEIYLTTLYGYGLELRNDETFSPRGMDFSFREGYPDVYWEIYSPAYGEDDFSSPYWRSHEATYSTGYHEFDTIYLYHFSPADNFKIGVYDRDDLSRNDFLGDWYGSIKEFETDSSKTIKFDNLAWFRMRAVQKGCVNK